MKSQAKAIIVVGMHRSGTSALSGELNSLGVFMGKKLFKAQKGVNEKGFWENAKLVGINEQLLESINSCWDDPTLIQRCHELAESSLFESAKAFILDEYSDAKLWGMKDPRVSMLLPFWNKVFSELDIQPNIILMLRNPFEVAASLAKRDGFSQQKGLTLWLNYNFSSYLYTQKTNRLIVDFSKLIETPTSIREQIAAKFDLQTKQQPSFIDSKLRNQKASTNESNTSCELTYIADKLYDAIRQDATAEVRQLHDRYQTFLASYFHPVLVEHLNSVTQSEIHFRNVFEAAYETLSWKLSSPFRKFEQRIFGRNGKL